MLAWCPLPSYTLAAFAGMITGRDILCFVSGALFSADDRVLDTTIVYHFGIWGDLLLYSPSIVAGLF